MSGQVSNPTFEVVATTRRRWSLEEKEAILAEAAKGSVSEVARRRGIARDLIFRWRRDERDKKERQAPGFVPVLRGPAPAYLSSTFEIALANGRRIKVDQSVDPTVLKRVVEALEGR